MAKYTDSEAMEFETVRTATERTREILESIDKQVISERLMVITIVMILKGFHLLLYIQIHLPTLSIIPALWVVPGHPL